MSLGIKGERDIENLYEYVSNKCNIIMSLKYKFPNYPGMIYPTNWISLKTYDGQLLEINSIWHPTKINNKLKKYVMNQISRNYIQHIKNF